MRRPIETLCLILLALVGSSSVAQLQPETTPGDQQLEFRTWTDATGEYRTEAAMLRYADGKVDLQKRDGGQVSLPVSRLSRADQRYVREELRRRRSQQRTPEQPARAGTTGTADWPGWRGPHRDGKSPDTGLLKQWPSDGPRGLWHATGIGKGFSTVAVTSGMVYTSGDVDGRLCVFALDLDGNPLWKIDHDQAWTKSHPGSRSTPMIDGGNLYIVSGHGLVGCYDAKSGRPKWSRRLGEFGGRPPGWGYSESVLILDNLAVVTPGGQNCIVALDKRSGQPVWASQGFAAEAQYGGCYAFTHGGVSMIAAGTRAGIVCVDAESGRMLWSNPFSANNTANCPTPVCSDGYLFWANGYGKGGICLKLAGGRGRVGAREAWTTRDMVCHHGGYIVHEGYIYGNNGSGWACLDLGTGQKMWEARGVGKGSICFADGMLYLFGESGGKAGLGTCSPQGMELRGTFAVQGEGPSWAHPVVVGGRLYLRYDDNLYCYDVKAG